MSDRTDLAIQVVTAIRSVVGAGPAPLSEPSFAGNEWLYLKECLDSTFVSSVGKFVDRFEIDLAKFTGAKYAVAVVNGTAALHIALKLAGVKAGDEVLVPALTFIATTNAVAYCNASPHLVDSDLVTLGVDAVKLRNYLLSHTEQRSNQCINNRATGQVIRALVPMHTFGHPVDMDGLLAIAHDFNILLVEDAAESLGSYYQGQHTGTFGLMGTLSFNGNKAITTGGGGAILTNDAKHLTTTAKLPHAWEFRHDEIGYNYRLPNLNAALGCAQLEQLPVKLSAKKALFACYLIAFERVVGVKLMPEPEKCQSNYWLQTLLLDVGNEDQRDAILKVNNDAGFMTRPAWTLMDELTPFKGCPRMDLTMAKSLVQRLINIPSSSHLVLAAS
ncbi:LegC family aminotransferase [Polynucleobacter sp. AM-25C3]|uniref:LegC family aminotransferase n=1 Tax=Polynucleobacter sp. AM-25C3 TaxID=1855569 RepID=UPI001C0D52A8|nr:LegC family aminotransferase [Polynucleobacter sp. AM-25C3]MBU3601771.1 LegC family aminotransferase [Polynucleobacter sp. AM-25C3]